MTYNSYPLIATGPVIPTETSTTADEGNVFAFTIDLKNLPSATIQILAYDQTADEGAILTSFMPQQYATFPTPPKRSPRRR